MPRTQDDLRKPGRCSVALALPLTLSPNSITERELWPSTCVVRVLGAAVPETAALAIRPMTQHQHCQAPIAAGMVHLTGGGAAMKVIVLKVKHRQNLDELDEVIHQGRTLEDGLGGWQMPKDAQPGDLAIWYAASPDQEYRAYGWVSGTPRKPDSELIKYYGPVAGVRPLTPVPRREVAAACGFNEKGVGQLAETVHECVEDFLLAVGFDRRFVAARELISDEVARVLR